MNDHITKPIDPDVLFATLMRWAKPRQAHAPAILAKQDGIPNDVIIPQVANVDSAGGLKRVAGNKRLYRDLLTQFAETQADAAAQISDALQIGDRKLAERIAHTVKGVAGNIGITQIQFAAARLEKAFREDDPAIPALVAEFDTLLHTQVQAIAKGLSETQPVISGARANSKFDPGAASAAVARLKSLLEASDGDAEEAFVSLQDAFAGQVEEIRLRALGAAIRDFDFESALVKLEEIVREHSLSGGKAAR
jgi:HPt (histidine-containing phosphotransfer) domain-containing protein